MQSLSKKIPLNIYLLRQIKLRKILLFFCLLVSVLQAADIPHEHEEALNSVVSKVFQASEPDLIERLLKGLSSPGLYKIEVAGKCYVVRFSNTRRSLEDRQRELHAMQVASEIGIAPKVIYADLQEGIIVMDFIATSVTNPLSDESLELLGRAMREVHDGPSFHSGHSVFEDVKYFESLMPDDKPAIIVQSSNVLAQLQMELKLIEKPCHNDLNPNNVLYSNGKVYFIDWEHAGQGDPFFDIVTPIVLYRMDQHKQDILLNAYFERKLNSEESIKLQKMKTVAQIFYGFALIGISLMQGQAHLTEDEISSSEEIIFPQGMQRFGFALLRQAQEGEN